MQFYSFKVHICMNNCITVRPDLIKCQSSQNYHDFRSFSAKLLQSLLDLTTYKIYKINSIPAASNKNIEVNKTKNQSWLNVCLWYGLVIGIHYLFQFNQLRTYTTTILSGKHSLSVWGRVCCLPSISIWQLRALIYHDKQPCTYLSLPLSSCLSSLCKFSLAGYQILLSWGHLQIFSFKKVSHL